MCSSDLSDRVRFDLAGYLLLAFGMVAVSLALDGLSGLGLRQASVLVLMIFGLASLTEVVLKRGQCVTKFREQCSMRAQLIRVRIEPVQCCVEDRC